MRVLVAIVVTVVLVAALGSAGFEPFQTITNNVTAFFHQAGHEAEVLVIKPHGAYRSAAGLDTTITFLTDFDLTISSGVTNAVAYKYGEAAMDLSY